MSVVAVQNDAQHHAPALPPLPLGFVGRPEALRELCWLSSFIAMMPWSTSLALTDMSRSLNCVYCCTKSRTCGDCIRNEYGNGTAQSSRI